jgi:competence protein ComEC
MRSNDHRGGERIDRVGSNSPLQATRFTWVLHHRLADPGRVRMEVAGCLLLVAKRAVRRVVMKWFIATIFLVTGQRSLFAQDAAPLCVTPSSDVVTSVSIRQAPTTSSPLIGKLAPGQQLPLVGEVPSWYLVQISAEVVGHIAKRWARTQTCPGAPVRPVSEGATYELDAIDVGTGLSVFVHGADFSLLYDAGSNDDLARGDKNRVVTYLQAQYPDVHTIDHAILSHPHRDHVELMPDVITTHTVKNVWDSGAYNDICGYREFLRAIASTGSQYHNANKAAGDEVLTLTEKSCRGTSESAPSITLHHGARIDSTPIALGAGASMQFLHVDGTHHADFNDNSLVMRLTLGDHSIMFMGDAEAGGRAAPSNVPKPTSVEGKLLACCKDQIHADVLVVGHHGSMSSSRRALLDAVGASVFLVSAGPTKYSDVVLPDQVVIDELSSRGSVMRTDTNDVACKASSTKSGPAADGEAGGCNTIRVIFNATGVHATYFP